MLKDCYVSGVIIFNGMPYSDGTFKWWSRGGDAKARQSTLPITYWKSQLARLRIRTPQPPFERSIRVRHFIADNTTTVITVLKHNIHLAWANLREIQKDSITIRDQHRNDLADKYATNYGWTKETALRQMRLWEESRQMAKTTMVHQTTDPRRCANPPCTTHKRRWI